MIYAKYIYSEKRVYLIHSSEFWEATVKSLYFFICMYMVVQLLLPIYKVCLCQLISGFGYIISSYFL